MADPVLDFQEEAPIDFQEEAAKPSYTPFVPAKNLVLPPVPGTDLGMWGEGTLSASRTGAGAEAIQAAGTPANLAKQLVSVPFAAAGELVKGAAAVGTGMARAASELVNPVTWAPEQREKRFGETPEDIEANRPFATGRPLIAPSGNALNPEGSDASRLISSLSTPENILMLAGGGASKVLGAAMLASMVPGVFEDVQRVASSETSMEEKRDRINSLILPVLLGLRATKPRGVAPPLPESPVLPPLEFTGEALPGRPRGATPVRPVSGPVILGPEVPKRGLPGVEVPETPAEPERDLTAIQEVRTKNARTTKAIQAIYPHLSNEAAAELRRQAWGGASETGVVVSPTIPRPTPMPELTLQPPPPPEVPPGITAEQQRIAEEVRTEQIRRSGLEQGIITQERELQHAVASGDKIGERNATAKLMELRRQYEAPPPLAKRPILPKPPIPGVARSLFKPEVPGTPAEAREDVLTTIRNAGARTTRAVKELFPNAGLNNERAAQLRDQAFPEDAEERTIERTSPKQRENLPPKQPPPTAPPGTPVLKPAPPTPSTPAIPSSTIPPEGLGEPPVSPPAASTPPPAPPAAPTPLPPAPAPAAPAAQAAKPTVARLEPMVPGKVRNSLGDPAGTTYHASPEDWAKWQDATARRDALKNLPIKERFQALAPITAEIEAIKNKYGGMPPEPPAAASAAEPVPKPKPPAPLAPGLSADQPVPPEQFPPFPRTGVRRVTIRRPDGTTYEAAADEREWPKEILPPGVTSGALIHRVTLDKNGKPEWSSAMLRPGETLIEHTVPTPTVVPPQEPVPVEPAAPPAEPVAATANDPIIAGQPLSHWEAARTVDDLPKGDARAELAKKLAVVNQPSKILAALKNKRRTREILAPPLTPEAALPAEPTLPAPEATSPSAPTPAQPKPEAPASRIAPSPETQLDTNFRNLLGELLGTSGSKANIATIQKAFDRALREERITQDQHLYLTDRLSERLKSVVEKKLAKPFEEGQPEQGIPPVARQGEIGMMLSPPSTNPTIEAAQKAVDEIQAKLGANEVERNNKFALRNKLSGRDYEQNEKEINALAGESYNLKAEWDKANLALLSAKGEAGIERMHRETAQFRGQPQPQPSPPKITTKVLTAQRENLLDQVNEALKTAPENGPEKITFSVPGDGDWTISNTQDRLKNFKALVTKEFPKTVASNKSGVPKTAKGRAMPKAAEPTKEDLPKIAASSTSEDPTRFAIQSAYADGTQIVATDGRQLLRIVSGDSPGTPALPVRINSEGRVDPSNTSNFPNFKQVIPTDPTLALGGAKTDELWHIARQAQAFKNSFDKPQESVEIFVNPDRSLGGNMPQVDQSFEHNVQPGAISLGPYNADYLFNMADTARRLGNEKVDIYVSSTEGPLEIVGKNHQHLLMPMRIGNAPAVRPEPNTIPPAVSGRKINTRPAPGFGPLQNPESFNSLEVSTGNGKFRVSYEGGIFKVERFVPKQGSYSSHRWENVVGFSRGEQNAAEISQAIASATEKQVEKGTAKTILGAMNSLEKDRQSAIDEGKARQKGPAISVGPGAASPAEFEERGPSPAAMGLSAGNPAINRVAALAKNVSRAIGQLFARSPVKQDISLLANGANTVARVAGQTGGNSLRLRASTPERRAVTLIMQALKMSGDGLSQEDAARLGELEFAGDPIAYLKDGQTRMEVAAQTFLQQGKRLEAQAAIDAAKTAELARQRYNQLLMVARRARGQLNAQWGREQAEGVDTDYERWYVPQRHELDLFTASDKPIVLGGSKGGGVATGFKKAKVFEDYFTAIENGFVPRSMDIADLVEHRIGQGERLIQRKALFDKLKDMKDPADGMPLAMKIPRRVIVRPDGTPDVQESVPRGYTPFEIVPGYRLAIHDGFAPLMKALTGTSSLAASDVGAALTEVAAASKHLGLMIDTFHASRTMQAELALTGKLSILGRQKQGLALVEYKPSDLGQAVSNGLITQEMADWVTKKNPVEIGGRTVQRSPHDIIMLGAENGLMMARVGDVLYRDWIRQIPVIGDVQRWVFDKMTRSAISLSFLSEFERAAKANPQLAEEPLARMVARNVNAVFGNIGKESIFKNPEINAINQILFLAPKWVESLTTREILASRQAAGAAVNLVRGKPVYLGTAARTLGNGLAAYFVVTQMVNLFTRGHLTFQNQEAGHKLDAWIPDWTGKTKGFFLSPLSVFAEITHDFIQLASKKPDFASVATQIGANKLGNLGKMFEVMLTGRDPFSGEKIIGSARRALKAGAQMIPIPIVASQGAAALGHAIAPELVKAPQPGAVQRQITSSFGFKTEPVGSAQQQVRSLARNWALASKESRIRNAAERRLKEDFTSDYSDLRGALTRGAMDEARTAYEALKESGKSPEVIRRTMAHPHPFTGGARTERMFMHSLKPEQRQLYREALRERQDLYRKFQQMLREQRPQPQ